MLFLIGVLILRQDEWAEIEAAYEREVLSITIPQDITEGVIKLLLSRIDEVLTRAQFDYARSKRAYENLERRLKTRTKAYYVDFKASYSDKTADAHATKRVDDEGLTHQVQEAYNRYTFMDAVISVLDAKRSMLITDSGILKIEASLK